MRIILLSLLLSLASVMDAQVRPKQHDWLFYDISYDYLLNTPPGMEQGWRSNGHAISVMDDKVFGNSNFGIGYGLGYMSNNYFNNLGISTSFASGDSQMRLLDMDTVNNNKFTIQQIFIPFEIRIRTGLDEKRNFWRLYLGGRIGVRIHSYSELETEKATVQYKHLDNLSRFTYGAYARIGYDHLSIYTYYNISELFEKGEVMHAGIPFSLKDLRAISIGISLSL